MSITYMGARNGPYDKDRNGNIASSRVLVYHFTAAESSVEVAQQAEIPDHGTAHPDDATLKLVGVAVSEPTMGDGIKSGRYDVTLSYAREVRSGSFAADQTVAPWKRDPYDISLQPVEYAKAFTKSYVDGDSNGNPSNPVLNPAGDPYEDTVVERNTCLRFAYNLEDWNPNWVCDYIDTVNSSDVLVCDIGIRSRRGCIRNLSATRIVEYDNEGAQTYVYWRIDVEIEVSRKRWLRDILARGLNFISGGAKYRIYTDNAGNFGKKADMGDDAIAVDEPQLLAANGSLVGYGGTPVYQTFYDKYTTSWKCLSFPGRAQS